MVESFVVRGLFIVIIGAAAVFRESATANKPAAECALTAHPDKWTPVLGGVNEYSQYGNRNADLDKAHGFR